MPAPTRRWSPSRGGRSGGTWSTGWTAEFDSSPTYSWGEDDNDATHWQFLDPEHPMAPMQRAAVVLQEQAISITNHRFGNRDAEFEHVLPQ